MGCMANLSKRKLWAFRLILLGAIYGFSEFAALLAITIQAGGMKSVHREMDSVAANKPLGVAAHITDRVIHPYLGYVSVPGEFGKYRVGDYGFLDSGEPIHKREPGTIIVAVTGGSVAQNMLLHDGGPESLTQPLESATGNRVVLVRLAAAGYKQPQQVAVLSHLLSLGAEFDIVVNLDGFNEVVLPQTDLAPFDIAIQYPWTWRSNVHDSLDSDAHIRAARAAVLSEQSRSSAQAVSGSIFRYSPLVTLIWKARYTQARKRIQAEEAALSEASKNRKAYWLNGPRQAHDNLDSDCVELWRQSSLQMHRICAANGIRYVHCLQPNQYTGQKTIGEAERAIAWNVEQPCKAIVERCYPMLKDAGKELSESGVDFRDLTDSFANHTGPLYSDDSCHVDANGSAILAEEIAEILTKPPTPQPTSQSVPLHPTSLQRHTLANKQPPERDMP